MFQVRMAQNKQIIERVDTHRKAKAIICVLEEGDKLINDFANNYYEIYNEETQQTE